MSSKHKHDIRDAIILILLVTALVILANLKK